MKTIILGAGFAGMAAGIKTGAPIFEATKRPGGICNSYNLKGFEFFNGGPHLLFDKGPGLDYIKSLVPVREYAKKASVYYHKMFPYPIQTTAQQKTEITPGSFKDWCHRHFSEAECNLFFDPFNEKYTAGLYNQVIQYDDYKTPPAGSNGFVSTFCDPVNGLGDVVNKMADQCDIRYGKRAISISTAGKFITFEDGHVEYYDRLVSTIPLCDLLAICGHEGYKELPYSSVLVLNVGAERGPNTPHEHWVYIPFCKNQFHRISFYSNIEPSKAPEGKVNMSVEIAFSGYDYERDIDAPFAMQEVTRELQDWGFIGDVIVSDPTWVKHAYTWLPIYGDRLQSISKRDGYLSWLKDKGIISTGRYGKWHFQGLCSSIKDGFEVEP